jgi:NADH:ubiquinone oxidoreductase subunit 6 (subunit J)
MRVFTERVYVGKSPPLGFILVVLIAGLLSAAMLILLLGAFLIALPVVVVFVTAAIVAGLLRMYFSPSD